MTATFFDRNGKPQEVTLPLVTRADQKRASWSAEIDGHTLRATAVPYSSDAYDPDQKKIAERFQQHYATMRTEAIAQGVRLDDFFAWGSVMNRGVNAGDGGYRLKPATLPIIGEYYDANRPRDDERKVKPTSGKVSPIVKQRDTSNDR